MRRGVLPSIIEPPLFLSPDNRYGEGEFRNRWEGGKSRCWWLGQHPSADSKSSD